MAKDLIGLGLAWLYGQQQGYASVPATYRRISANNENQGTVHVAVKAVPAPSPGLLVSGTTNAPTDPSKAPRDFLLLVSDLVASGEAFLPRVHDQVIETLNGLSHAYTVSSPPQGGPVFDYVTGYRDPTQTMIRVHTKYSGLTTIDDSVAFSCSGAALCDRFEDAPSKALTSHTMNVGAGWLSAFGTSASWRISSPEGDQAVCFFAPGGSTTAWNGITAQGNLANGTVLVEQPVGEDGCRQGLIFRHVNAHNYWRLYLQTATVGGDPPGLYLVKVVSDAETTVVSAACTVTLPKTVTLSVTLSGNSIICSLEGADGGTVMLSATDIALASATRYGLCVRVESSVVQGGVWNAFRALLSA